MIDNAAESVRPYPIVLYIASLDMLTIYFEDVSYRVSPVDGALSLLFAPHEERVIGIKLEGCRLIIDDLFLESKEGVVWGLSVATLLRAVAACFKNLRHVDAYEQARKLVGYVRISQEHLAEKTEPGDPKDMNAFLDQIMTGKQRL